jgi:hypothetical protein
VYQHQLELVAILGLDINVFLGGYLDLTVSALELWMDIDFFDLGNFIGNTPTSSTALNHRLPSSINFSFILQITLSSKQPSIFYNDSLKVVLLKV